MILPTLTIKPLLITIAALTVLLLASGWWNVSQFRAAAIAEQAHKEEIRALQDEATIAGLTASIGISRRLAAEATQRADKIIEDLRGIALENERLQQEYWRKWKAIPALAPQCAPGEMRVEAFNERSP
jgi:hypothetical protein